jgi:hypothetical protein
MDWKNLDDDVLAKGIEETSKSGGFRFFLPKGYTRFRIVRNPDDPQFWRVIGEHRIGKHAFPCLKKTFGEACPICDVRDTDPGKFSFLYASRRGIVNAVIEGVSTDGATWEQADTSRKVALTVLPVSVLNEIFLRIRMLPPEARDITHPQTGRSIIVFRHGDGLDTKYVVNLADPTPVTYYDSSEYMSEMTDLAEYVAGMRVSYEDLKRQFQEYMQASAAQAAMAGGVAGTAAPLPSGGANPSSEPPSIPPSGTPEPVQTNSSEGKGGSDLDEYRKEISEVLRKLGGGK